jgi:hypothetical protein
MKNNINNWTKQLKKSRVELLDTNEPKNTAANIGFCASWADGTRINICNSVVLLLQLDSKLLGFCTKPLLLFFNLAAVTGRRNFISQLAQSPFRWLQAILTP